MAQQTALEWLVEQLSCVGIHVGYGLLEQAKQMEKEQIKDAYYYDPNTSDVKDDGEQYYNETFSKQ